MVTSMLSTMFLKVFLALLALLFQSMFIVLFIVLIVFRAYIAAAVAAMMTVTISIGRPVIISETIAGKDEMDVTVGTDADISSVTDDMDFRRTCASLWRKSSGRSKKKAGERQEDDVSFHGLSLLIGYTIKTPHAHLGFKPWLM